MKTYKIVRMFFSDDIKSKVIKRGLSLKEAQRHCRDKQTSSSTCTDSKGIELAKQVGPWFDGYEEVA